VLVGGNERITIRLPDGASMRVPRGWTDADRAEVQPPKARDQFYTVEALRRLSFLVEALLTRSK